MQGGEQMTVSDTCLGSCGPACWESRARSTTQDPGLAAALSFEDWRLAQQPAT